MELRDWATEVDNYLETNRQEFQDPVVVMATAFCELEKHVYDEWHTTGWDPNTTPRYCKTGQPTDPPSPPNPPDDWDD
jgi:hypothetical protein